MGWDLAPVGAMIGPEYPQPMLVQVDIKVVHRPRCAPS
jgi:hypothetical protein